MLDGITGESQKENHEGEIDLMTFSLGATNFHSVSVGTGASTGKVSLQDFHLTKSTDSSSPVLFQKCCDGHIFSTCTVSLQRQVAGQATPYLVYKFTNVYIDSIQWSGSGGATDDSPSESISFAFSTMAVEYTQLLDDGSQGNTVHGGWDQSRNMKV
jgi:type VI secretion system secreted protein Hcp